MNIVKTHKNGGILPGNFRAKKLFSIIIAYSLEKFKTVWYNYKSEERESSPPIVYAFVAQLDRALASDARCRGFESLQAHLKTSLQCTFAMGFLFQCYSGFRIILVTYHLPHRCIGLLPAVHFSADL